MKPTVNTNPGANRYTSPNERIVEFSTRRGTGGLICLREEDDGSLSVQLYRLDPMTVSVSFDNGTARATQAHQGVIITPA